MKGKIDRNVLAWLYRTSGREKQNIVLLIVVQAFFGVSTVLFAWLLRGGIDSAVEGNKEGFLSYALAMVLLVLLELAMGAVRRFLDEYTKSGLENRFKTQLLEQLLTRDYAQVMSVHSAEWMNRLTSDVVVVAEGLTIILPDVIGLSVKLVSAVTALIILVPKLGYLIIPGGIFLLIFSTMSRNILKKMHVKIQEADGRLRVFMSERISSLLIVRTFARERQILEEAEEKMWNHRKARMNRNHYSNFCNVGFLVVMKAVYIICVLFCGYGILRGSISYGSFTAVLQLVGQVQSPFASLTSYLPKFYALLASAERLLEAEEFEQVVREEMFSIEQIRDFYENGFQALYLKNVNFTYMPPVSGDGQAQTEMPVVLQNLYVKIYKGECVALTGPSGSGKSTVLKLLMGLYKPDSGKRCLMFSEKEIPLDFHYTRLFSYVPQGNHLMSGTIREVVVFSDKEKMEDEEGICRSLELACALEFVKELSEGLDTRLGERGTGLSEGQMQRIAIARAIYTDNPILILDEATSALDEATERRLVSNLRQLTDKTVLLVTHRPEMMKLCTREITLGNNQMEEVENEFR